MKFTDIEPGRILLDEDGTKYLKPVQDPDLHLDGQVICMATGRVTHYSRLQRYSVQEQDFHKTLTPEELKDAIVQALKIPPYATDLQITVRVPGGGDWSNTDLDLFAETNLEARWKA